MTTIHLQRTFHSIFLMKSTQNDIIQVDPNMSTPIIFSFSKIGIALGERAQAKRAPHLHEKQQNANHNFRVFDIVENEFNSRIIHI